MKVVSFGLLLITVVAGAPTIINSIPNYITERQLLDQLRYKRKITPGYGVGMQMGVGSPIALSSHISSYLPYQWNMRPYMNPYGYSNFGYQSLYGCGRGLLRSEDQNDQEEQEHSPNRHSEISPSNLASVGQLVTTPGGPAYGVFPNVPSNDCNVPLLFSCAPTIVPGKVSRGSSPIYGLPGFNGFRDVDYGVDPHMQEHTVHENTAMGDASHVVKD
ncbi:unnamed protein product [Pieris brassicae]|uniref:Uncharacterized protein n=1 Tax=Pieris brassicae TaxID=7116 RepID=A0A9P0XJG3_PIEBR|nr:unnamed protein product [Pieris brassicae]